jgi:chromosome segregation ATPase
MGRNLLVYLALLSLVGCATTDDPRQGGLFSYQPSKYEERLRARQQTLKELQLDKQRLEEENQSLASTVRAKQEKHDRLLGQLHALDDDLARLQQDLQHYQAETAGQREKKRRVEGAISRLQGQIKALRHETQPAIRSRTEQEKKLAELQREIDDLLTISTHLQSSVQEDCVVLSGESLKNVCTADHKR